MLMWFPYWIVNPLNILPSMSPCITHQPTGGLDIAELLDCLGFKMTYSDLPYLQPR